MIKFTTQDGQITHAQYDALLIPWDDPYESSNHEQLAERYAERQLASVLIDREFLDDDLLENPEYNRIDRNLYASEIDDEAIKRFGQRYMSMEEADALIKEQEINTRATNYDDTNLRSKLLDGIFDAQWLSLYPEVIESFKHDFKTLYNEDTEEETERPNWEADWPRELVKRLMPRVNTRYERVYSVPNPFTHWDSRNRAQQWYFIGNSDFTSVSATHGGSGSSGARLAQGLMAHTFALLASQGKDIPTWHLRYDRRNKLRLINQWPDFHVLGQDLSGNYQVDLRKTEHLFKDRLINLETYNWGD